MLLRTKGKRTRRTCLLQYYVSAASRGGAESQHNEPILAHSRHASKFLSLKYTIHKNELSGKSQLHPRTTHWNPFWDTWKLYMANPSSQKRVIDFATLKWSVKIGAFCEYIGKLWIFSCSENALQVFFPTDLHGLLYWCGRTAGCKEGCIAVALKW